MDYLPADHYWVALSGAIWHGPDPNHWMSAGGIGGSAARCIIIQMDRRKIVLRPSQPKICFNLDGGRNS
eukprot:2628129-Amphidinium_carterae.1